MELYAVSKSYFILISKRTNNHQNNRGRDDKKPITKILELYYSVTSHNILIFSIRF